MLLTHCFLCSKGPRSHNMILWECDRLVWF